MALPSLFSFDGRARRSEWWLTNIGVALLSTLAQFVGGLLITGGDPATATGGAQAVALVAVALVSSFLAAWAQIAVSARRRHDLGRSATPIIGFAAIGVAMNVAIILMGEAGLKAVLASGLSFFLLGLWTCLILALAYFVVTLGFFPGDPTANTYGTPR